VVEIGENLRIAVDTVAICLFLSVLVWAASR
jgi:hypothetical protein